MTPRLPGPRRAAAVMVTLACGVGPGVARADAHVAACLEAHVAGQELRASGRLGEARARLVACGAAECPAPVRADCAAWLAEVDRDRPTIVPAARSTGGRDLDEVRVLLDGREIATRLDGREVPVDPGSHVVRFVAPGAEPVDVPVVVRVGEKNRAVTGAIALPEPARRDLLVGAAITGGLGVAAAAVFVGLAATGEARRSELSSTCSPRCAPGDVDALRTRFVAADVALGVGVASLAVATVLFVVGRPGASRPAAPPPSALRVEATSSGLALRF